MEEFKTLSLEEIKNKIETNQNLHLVSVDYDNKNGIRLEKDVEFSKLDTILEEIKNFYKLYIFNDDFMLSVFKFGDNEYKYNKILKEDFTKESIKYIYMKEHERLKVRIGKIGEREVIQYISFEKGGNENE